MILTRHFKPELEQIVFWSYKFETHLNKNEVLTSLSGLEKRNLQLKSLPFFTNYPI